MKKKYILIIVIILILMMLVVLIPNAINKEKTSVQYANFFEYAVDLQHNEYTYAPNGAVEYGMSMEAVLEAEGLNKSAIDSMDSDWVGMTKSLNNITESIGKIEFAKRYYIYPEFGLSSVQYTFIMDKEDFGEFSVMLAEQAEEYMPKLEYTSLAQQIRVNERVVWKSENSNENVMNTYVDIGIGSDALKKSVVIRIGIDRDDILQWLKEHE